MNALVFDFGARSSRIGFAGEDAPHSSINTLTSTHIQSGKQSLLTDHLIFRPKSEVKIDPIIQEGIGM